MNRLDPRRLGLPSDIIQVIERLKVRGVIRISFETAIQNKKQNPRKGFAKPRHIKHHPRFSL